MNRSFYRELTAIAVAGKNIKVRKATVFIEELSRRVSSAICDDQERVRIFVLDWKERTMILNFVSLYDKVSKYYPVIFRARGRYHSVLLLYAQQNCVNIQL